MMDDYKLPAKAAGLKTWTKRRTDKGWAVSADEMWGWIKRNCASASEEQKERIFQAASARF